MQSFTYCSPTDIVFGKGAEENLSRMVQKHGGKRVFLVYGGESAIKTGLLSRLERNLTENGMAFYAMGGVQPNPRVSLARRMTREAISFKVDFIVGAGGGSVLDTAKAVAHGVANPTIDIWDFWTGRAKLEHSLPIGAIPTMPAAGSETSDSAVLTNEEMGLKLGLSSFFNRPTFALMNPELAYTLPPYQLSCGLADILMHTLERYMSVVDGNHLTDLFAESLMKDVIAAAKVLKDKPQDYDAMSEAAWCASVSHTDFTGLGRPKDFSVHKLSFSLSADYDIAHGAALTALWGSWAHFVQKKVPHRFTRFADTVWEVHEGSEEERGALGIHRAEEFFRFLGLPTSMRELGISLQETDLARMANEVTKQGKVQIGTFYPLDRDLVLEVYRRANR